MGDLQFFHAMKKNDAPRKRKKAETVQLRGQLPDT